ncbi:PQQ-dependent sugar dehydrogenase [Flagellimonas zhangzhouensis]|uniref:Glucose/arabinose dehydrogenase, beta-propeller fold n=1 Tax=Flagellimonas zhangzhouensis TaxID=1073328 RepID=A0A1H2R7S3_9FLAO|nr:PQQ-dependent sugar dehydrogenase [Allomuricauda zhangzhouensis]SDQ60553.1 Glucose/arabinose dehydrogenase, beta-propeller fold [Allomuricauda zhangzhouensis]SDW15502.1 Glucose/arabinose dehydrogenase, beta-propeller fold [Allomuricauda zhangzhouensis]
MQKSLLLPYFFVVLLSTSCAQNSDKGINIPKTLDFTADLVVGDLQNPWGMVFLPNNAILISEKTGKLILFSSGKTTEIENPPEVYNRGQGGLMDIELHPNYVENGWIYFSHASPEGNDKGGNTAIMRARLKNNRLIDQEVLYKATPNSTRGQHFGSRIEFDNDGFLYFSIGERGNRDVNPQDITRDGGKIYRLHDDGNIPKDNPFMNEKGAKTAIYSYGHRNPQGLTLHPETGVLWEHEHGPRGGDEINIIQKGKNYGWPIVTYGVNYSGTKITNDTSKPGMEQPFYQWTPSIAPSGMTFVTSDKYPKWKGSLLVGSLAFQYLERLEIKDNKVVYREKLLDGLGRVRNVRKAPDGYIYVAIEGKGIYKLTPK